MVLRILNKIIKTARKNNKISKINLNQYNNDFFGNQYIFYT